MTPFPYKYLGQLTSMVLVLLFMRPSGEAAPTAKYVPGELLVVINNEPNGKNEADLNAELGVVEKLLPGRVHRSIPLGKRRMVKRIKLAAGVGVEEALQRKPVHLRILAVEPNYICHGDSFVPNDPAFRLQWGLHNTNDTHADIRAPEAWDITKGDSSLIVAVVDSGIRMTHQDLAPNLWTNPGEIGANGTDDDGNGYVDDLHGWNFADNNNDPTDRNGHGTHVSGIIGARGNNGAAGAGAAWNVRIMPCRFLDASNEGTTDAAVEAIRYAVDNGAQIINGSFSGGDSQALHDAILYAADHDVLYVCSAGNDARNIDQAPSYPASYNERNMIAVAATDRYDQLASTYSNYGSGTVALGAPGDAILSTWFSGDTATQYLSGTSQAAPFVSGTAALMLSRNPSLSISDLKGILLLSGDPLAALANKTTSGRRLNAYNALKASPAGAIWVDFNYGGFFENGSFDHPFRTIAQAVGAASSGTGLFIKPGSSGETLGISKPLTIQAVGGRVSIGQ